MKKNLTELVFIRDRSGSMSGLESDAIGSAIHHIGNVHKYAPEEDRAVTSMRCSPSLNPNWKHRIQHDVLHKSEVCAIISFGHFRRRTAKCSSRSAISSAAPAK